MFGFLIFIIVYLPFQIALSPSAGVDLASGRVLILGIFFWWLAESLRQKKILIRAKISTGLILTFLFLSSLSIIFSERSDWSLRKLLFLFSIIPLYFVAQALLNTEKRKEKIIKALVYSSFAVSVVGILQFFAQFIIGREKVYQIWADYVAVLFLGKSFSQAVLENPSWLVNVAGETYLRATAFFPDPHMLSFFLGMTAPLAIGLLCISKERRTLNMIIVLAILLADFLTFSRGGYIGILIGTLFLLVIFFRKISRRYQIGLIFMTSLIILMSIIPSPINKRLQSSFDLKEGSNKGRLETWSQSAEVIRDNPLFGVGIGNYPLEIKASADYREPIYSHNAYLDIASETGVLNVFVWISFLFFTILGLFKSKNQYLVFASASVIVFSAHSLVETGIYSVAVLPIFLVIASLNNE